MEFPYLLAQLLPNSQVIFTHGLIRMSVDTFDCEVHDSQSVGEVAYDLVPLDTLPDIIYSIINFLIGTELEVELD